MSEQTDRHGQAGRLTETDRQTHYTSNERIKRSSVVSQTFSMFLSHNSQAYLMKVSMDRTWEGLMYGFDFGSCDVIFKVTRDEEVLSNQNPFLGAQCCPK